MKMFFVRQRHRSGWVLLATAMVWLVSVTVCSTRATAELGDNHDDNAEAHEHAGHSHDSSHPDDQGGDDCSCKSFKAFPAQTVATAKAPLPAASHFLYLIPPHEFYYASFAIAITRKDTGPPERLSLAELILQQCRLGHAPPSVV